MLGPPNLLFKKESEIESFQTYVNKNYHSWTPLLKEILKDILQEGGEKLEQWVKEVSNALSN